MNTAPPLRRPMLAPCFTCRKPDSGAYGFITPGGPARAYCPDCTPSRTGLAGLRPAGDDLFGVAA